MWMATKEGKKQVFRELEKHAKETSELRKELNSINDKKESLFREKENISNNIRKLIARVKSCKNERDRLTKEV